MPLLPLNRSTFWVDVRLREINGRWIALADTPDGPTRARAGSRSGDRGGLEPFEGIMDELLASLADSPLT